MKNSVRECMEREVPEYLDDRILAAARFRAGLVRKKRRTHLKWGSAAAAAAALMIASSVYLLVQVPQEAPETVWSGDDSLYGTLWDEFDQSNYAIAANWNSESVELSDYYMGYWE